MYQLVYLSLATHPMSDEELDEILKSSHRNNPCKDISGLLLYGHQTFFQVLEGPKHKVEELYAFLHEDDRHLDACVLHAADVDARMFENWAMGFERLEETNREFAFFVKLSERIFADRASEADGQALLQKLSDISRRLLVAA